MSMRSETADPESEPEPATAATSSLTAFACLSTTQTSQARTLSWAVDTLNTIDFRLLRKDNTLHGLVQDCAGTILASLKGVLQCPATDNSCSFIPDVASMLSPSFLHLLFQYRRIFHVIAARDFQSGSVPMAVVCWVDLVLAKLGVVVAFIASGLDIDLPDQSLSESLRAQREEDNLRAAMQLPDSSDMLPSVLLSERTSSAAKRLSVRLLMGRYVLYPALSGRVSVDNTIHGLLPITMEFLKQTAARVDELRFVLGPGMKYLMQRERLTSAMAISLFAAADMAQDSATAFRPQTVSAAMQLLRFVLRDDGYLTQPNILSPLDTPTSVVIRWGIVPQWAWSTWLEYRSLHADTVISLTAAYIQHQKNSGTVSDISDLTTTGSWQDDQTAVISVIIDLVYRFISVFSANHHSKQHPTSMMSVLDGSCRYISQWINQNSCGIQSSMECCKALIVLFGYLSRNGEHVALNDLVIGCLASMKGQCTRDAWKAAIEDNKLFFLRVLGQGFIETKASLFHSRDDLAEHGGTRATQLMQFLVVMVSKGVKLSDLEMLVEFIEAVGEQVLEAPQGSQRFLCEAFLTCLASAKLSEFDLSLNKVTWAGDEDAIWHVGLCNRSTSLILASAFSLYIASTPVGVEPLTYLEGLEHLLDVAILICSRHYSGEDEPLALVVLPTICDALVHLLEHRDDTTSVYTSENTRISALGGALRSIGGRDDSVCDRFGALLKRRVSAAAERLLREIDGEEETHDRETRREYELVFCRHDGVSRLLYVVV